MRLCTKYTAFKQMGVKKKNLYTWQLCVIDYMGIWTHRELKTGSVVMSRRFTALK